MANLATAYVQIIPSARGMESNLTNLLNGKMPSAGKSAGNVLGSSIVSAVKKVILSAGLAKFFKEYPERSFDVGICEENACVLCSSLAVGGLKPYYAIYSTFLQRAFDEIVHDVCAQDLPVTFCIDRAGITGPDGDTHQGVFDLSYLSLIPNLAIATPKDTAELQKLLQFSEQYAHPLAIRYPRAGSVIFPADDRPITLGSWEYLHQENSKLTILACGERCLLLAMEILRNLKKEGLTFDVVNARFIKPLDKKILQNLKSEYIVTMEDNVEIGGFGSLVTSALSAMDSTCKIKCFAYKDTFIPQGSVGDLQREYGVDQEEIQRYIKRVLQ